MPSLLRRRSRATDFPPVKARRGFSLVEFGIVLAVIAVMAGVTIGSVGYFKASRQRTAVDLVLTLRKAAVQFMQRHSRGLAYGVSANTNNPQNVTMKGLRGEGFVPVNTSTPWGDALAEDAVIPSDGSSIGASALCSGYTCVTISIPVPADECTEGTIAEALRGNAVVNGISCTNSRLTVTMR